MCYWWNSDISVTQAIVLNAWYHILVTWDGAMRRVYVNGTQVNGICYKLATFYDVEPL